MSIQSTQTVPRWWAIARIQKIIDLTLDKDYQALELQSGEDSTSCGLTLKEFVDTYVIDTGIEKWTNEMLASKLVERFFRESIFHNYRVTDTGEEC